MKKRKSHVPHERTTPRREKLSWPGLKAKDHLTRVITRAVKEAREAREKEVWANKHVAQLLDYVSPETAVRHVLRETRRRGIRIPRFAEDLLRLLETAESMEHDYY
jgi:hypothetical protein